MVAFKLTGSDCSGHIERDWKLSFSNATSSSSFYFMVNLQYPSLTSHFLLFKTAFIEAKQGL